MDQLINVNEELFFAQAFERSAQKVWGEVIKPHGDIRGFGLTKNINGDYCVLILVSPNTKSPIPTELAVEYNGKIKVLSVIIQTCGEWNG